MTSPARSPRPNIQKVHDAGDEGGPSALQEEVSGRQQGGLGRSTWPCSPSGRRKAQVQRGGDGDPGQDGGGGRRCQGRLLLEPLLGLL